MSIKISYYSGHIESKPGTYKHIGIAQVDGNTYSHTEFSSLKEMQGIVKERIDNSILVKMGIQRMMEDE